MSKRTNHHSSNFEHFSTLNGSLKTEKITCTKENVTQKNDKKVEKCTKNKKRRLEKRFDPDEIPARIFFWLLAQLAQLVLHMLYGWHMCYEGPKAANFGGLSNTVIQILGKDNIQLCEYAGLCPPTQGQA